MQVYHIFCYINIYHNNVKKIISLEFFLVLTMKMTLSVIHYYIRNQRTKIHWYQSSAKSEVSAFRNFILELDIIIRKIKITILLNNKYHTKLRAEAVYDIELILLLTVSSIVLCLRAVSI